MSSSEPAAVPVATGNQFRLVLAAGLITTTLALLGVYLLNVHAGENIMGWYANYVIPAGAILVGLVAASGYGLASWLAGVKITKGLLWVILGLQVAAYFAAQYIEYMNMQMPEGFERPGFWTYFDFVTRSFTWKGRDGQPGQPLGAWGYGLRVLEVAGFVVGSLIVPIILWKKPYCNVCQVYYRSKALGLLPAGVKPRKVKKSDAEGQAAYAREQEEALNQGTALVAALTDAANQGDAGRFHAILAEHKPNRKAYGKLTRRIELAMQHCPRCCQGFLAATAAQGQGNQIQRTPLGQAPLGPAAVRAIKRDKGMGTRE